MRRVVLTCVLAMLAASRPTTAPATAPAVERPSPSVQIEAERNDAGRALLELERRQTRWPDDDARFDAAAKAAWAYVNGRFSPATGLVAPVRYYSVATVWDIGSMLAAVYAAHGLGLIDPPTYAGLMTRLLNTLQELPLYDNRMFNRAYQTNTGLMAPRRGPQTAGWSATDLGRLLIWLKIVGADPRFARQVETIVGRNDLSAVVKAGYLWGEDIDDTYQRPFRYQEGRIGYEQYAAQGFALWGFRAEKALDLGENAVPFPVMGRTLPADRRRWDRLTTEPFLLLGLEIGWDRRVEQVARNLIAVQAERYRRTGVLTLTSEDAIDQPPDYFYYYCVLTSGRQFGVDIQDRNRVVDGPRWVSAKAAFGLHVLLPSGYSRALLDRVRPAGAGGEWASGVYEATAAPTGTANINTAAVILEAALARRLGGPLLRYAQRSGGEQVGRSRS